MAQQSWLRGRAAAFRHGRLPRRDAAAQAETRTAAPFLEALEPRVLLSAAWQPSLNAYGQASPATVLVAADTPALPVGGDERVNPADFRITEFASGLDLPYGMEWLDDGSLLVATSKPTSTAGIWTSQGELLRLVDSDGDGVADGEPQVLFTGLPGIVSSVARAGDLVFVASAEVGNATISALRLGAAPADAMAFVGEVGFDFPVDSWHQVHELATRPRPDDPGVYELFFNVGSDDNFPQETSTVEAAGLFGGTLQVDSIYRVAVSDTGAEPTFSSPALIASGLRNATGIAFHPITGDMYFSEHGWDDPENNWDPVAADEINVIPADQIGGAVEDFGFRVPPDYIEYRTGRRVGEGAVQPIVTFQPIPFDDDVFVTPRNMNGWELTHEQTADLGSLSEFLVLADAPAGASNGGAWHHKSLWVNPGLTDHDFWRLELDVPGAPRLADWHGLEYRNFQVTQGGSHHAVVYFKLDLDGDLGTTDDQTFNQFRFQPFFAMQQLHAEDPVTYPDPLPQAGVWNTYPMPDQQTPLLEMSDGSGMTSIADYLAESGNSEARLVEVWVSGGSQGFDEVEEYIDYLELTFDADAGAGEDLHTTRYNFGEFDGFSVTGAESEGATQIAFAPPGFPAGLDNGIFLGFHGKFNDAGLANEENPFAYVDLDTGEYFHFIANDVPGIGHLNSVIANEDSLFVADLSRVGVLDNTDAAAGQGVIYQIKAVGANVEGATIAGLAWDDANGDGIRQQDEPRLTGITVRLFDPVNGVAGDGDDVQVGDDATTGAGGAYSFGGLDSGDYYAQFDLPDGRHFTRRNAGDDDAVDSDVNPAGGWSSPGRTAVVALAADEQRTDVDAGLVEAPLVVGGDERVNPNRFKVTVFAEGLPTPYGIQQLADGSLLVGSTVGGFGSQTGGQLLRLVDADGDGAVDGEPDVLASDIPGMVTGVRVFGDLVATVSVFFAGERVSYITLFRQGDSPSDPLTELGRVQIDYTFDNPENFFQHVASTLEVRPAPGQSEVYELFFQLGSERNGDDGVPTPTDETHHIDFSGLLTASNVPAERIYKVVIDDTAGAGVPGVTGPVAVASGVRNPAGMAVHPVTGDLYFQDNAADNNEIEGGHESLGADELNVIPAASLDDDGDVPDFGFPFRYVEYRTGEMVGEAPGSIDPLVAFQPWTDPQTGLESEGAAEIAIAPAAFPDGLNNGVFVGFHGRTASPDGSVDPESPVVFVDLETGEYFHFIKSDFFGDRGPLDSMLATGDALYLIDPFTGGTIYKVQALEDNDDGGNGEEPVVVEVDFGGRVRGQFADADGTGVTGVLKGPGTEKLRFVGEGDLVPDIVLTGTARQSRLVIKSDNGGDGRAAVGTIASDGDVAAITGKAIDFARVEVAGALRKLVLADAVADGETTPAIDIGSPQAGNAKAKLTLGRLAGLRITSEVAIASLTAQEWLDGAGDDSLSAPSLGRANVRGDFGADLRLAGTGLRPNAPALGQFRALGAITGGAWEVVGHARGVTASAIAGWTANIDGRLGKLATTGKDSAGALTGDVAVDALKTLAVKGDLVDARILAGADFGGDGAFGGGDDAFSTGNIGRVRVRGGMSNAVIAAGVNPTDGDYLSGNETVVGGAFSRIRSVVIRGPADDASFIGAGKLPRKVKVNGTAVPVTPDLDGDFLVGPLP